MCNNHPHFKFDTLNYFSIIYSSLKNNKKNINYYKKINFLSLCFLKKMSRVKEVKTGVADVGRFTVKRKFDDFSEDDIIEIEKLFREHEHGEDGQISFLKDPPPYISTIIRQCKALFNIKEEVESIQVTIYPCATDISKKEHKIKKTAMNIASRVVICVGHREIFNINVTGGGYEGSGKLYVSSGDAFQIIMGACAVADLIYDDTTSAMVSLRPNHRPKPMRKDPLKRYIIVVDGIVDAKVLVESIKKNLTTENVSTTDVDELVKEATTTIPVRHTVNSEDDD